MLNAFHFLIIDLMTRNEQSERDVGENLAEARALCERLDETLKNCASFFSGSFTRRVTELEERVIEAKAAT